MRLPLPDAPPAHPWLRRLTWFNLVAEILIVVTGGLVRLTGSGLGCPDWPQCVSGSLVPVAHQAQSWHKYVEFGNRMMTSVVSIAAVALLLALWRWGRHRKGLWLPVALILVGIAIQAVIGGISVHMDLNPAIVAGHFLSSMLLVFASAWLVWREHEGDGAPRPVVRREVRWIAWVVSALTVVILVLGTLVTGSGPHSGDATHPARLAIDPRTVAWLHADAVMLFCGLLVAVLIATRLAATSTRPTTAWLLVLAVTVLQGVIGYVQYFTGVPAGLVEIHMLGASLLVVAVTWGVLSLRERPHLPHPAEPERSPTASDRVASR